MDFATFLRDHRTFVISVGATLLVLFGVDAYVLHKRHLYREEIARLRHGMTRLERERSDALLASNQRRFQAIIDQARRQAAADKDLHLAVSVDSGAIFLAQEGALLREMPIEVAPEKVIGTGAVTVRLAVPRGARIIERLLTADSSWVVPSWVYTDRGLPVPAERSVKGALGPAAVVVSGGTVIYSQPTAGPLNDSTYILPGSVRVRARDLQAVLPNLKTGMTVYFY
jgi:hypothetical protein